MLGSLPKIPTWKADESGFEPQLSDSKAFVLPTKHTVIGMNRLFLGEVEYFWLAPWLCPAALGPCGISLPDFLHHSCDQAHALLASSRGPPYLPTQGQLPGVDLTGLRNPAPPWLSYWVFLTPSSWALWLQLLCSVMSHMFQLSASPSPLIIPFLSSLHLPNKIEQKTKQQKIKLQFSRPCHKSQNLNSCFFYEVPNPSLLLPLYLHLLPTLGFWSVAGGLSNWVVS